MGRGKPEEESSSSGELAEEEVGDESANTISEYEKQRAERIQENIARLKALGIPHLASSFLPNPSKKKTTNNRKKRKGTDDVDEDYRPSDEEGDREEEGAGENPSASGDKEVEGTSSKRRRKGKHKSSSLADKVRRNPSGNERLKESNDIDYNTALQQAIALSLGDATEFAGNDDISQNCGTNGARSSSSVKKERMNTLETAARKSGRKMNKSRPQLTEDEVVAHFFSFDMAGKGHITLRDLHRMVIAHDFNWTDLEMKSMIHCFDGDRDGMLSMEEFRSILSRLNMLQRTGEC